MSLQLLGPVRAWRCGEEARLGCPKQRALLGLLATRLNQVVTVEQIVDALWGSDAPATAVNGVHTYVSGLRRALEPDRSRRESGEVLVSGVGGYLLRTDPGEVDAVLFAHRYEQARRMVSDGEAAGALRMFGSALALWHGEAFGGVPGPYAVLERTRLQELRLRAVEEWAGVMIAGDRYEEAVVVLSEAVSQEPLREKLRCLLMLALYRCGRQAHALQVYRDTRQFLNEELGIEPGPELRQMHEQVLAGQLDSDLLMPVVLPAPVSAAARDIRLRGRLRPNQLPSSARVFVGRSAELAELHQMLTRRGQQRGRATPIVVIDGAAGVGKSAFALESARESLADFPDGRLYADLCGSSPRNAPLSSFDALDLLLRGLGVEQSRVPTDFEGRVALYRSLLHGSRMLVLLDDASNGEQLRPLIPPGPACVVITSRSRQSGLTVRDGAHQFRLGRLDPATSLDLLTALLGAERLEGRRAAAERLAEHCDHLPLALRIAAGALIENPLLSLEQLAQRYQDPGSRLDHLAVAGDDAASLRIAYAATYRSLPPPAAVLFRLLGKHGVGTISVAAAAELLGESPVCAGRRLGALAGHNLLEETGPGRYRFQELVRAFASECAASECAASESAQSVERESVPVRTAPLPMPQGARVPERVGPASRRGSTGAVAESS